MLVIQLFAEILELKHLQIVYKGENDLEADTFQKLMLGHSKTELDTCQTLQSL